jgi:pimeloyl-ACP methyl ester carboxylesterase
MHEERRDPRSLPPRATRDVAARGARIRFVDAGDGPPLLLIHDYLASHLTWEDVVPSLSRSFRVLAPDLPGFGESEKPAPGRYRYDLEAFSESLVDLLAAVGLVRVSLCGHGMGGAIALTLAASHPHFVDRVVLVSPLVYPQRPDLAARVAQMPLVGPLVFKQMYGRALFRRRFAARASSAVRRVDHLFDLFDSPAGREAAYAALGAVLDTRSVRASLPRVTVPSLIVWGRGHRTSPVEQGRRLARELAGARLEVFDCGPSPAEECPEAFAAAVTPFLQETRGG